MDQKNIIWACLGLAVVSVFLPWVGFFGISASGIQIWPGQLGIVLTLIGAGLVWKEVKLAYLVGAVNVLLGLYVLSVVGGFSQIGSLLFTVSSGAFAFLSFTSNK